jgi:diguanylate cyclase (GGDEF)-like protein/PAS domain S-box-containing protein
MWVLALLLLLLPASAQTPAPAGQTTQSHTAAARLVVGSEQDFPPFATGLTDATAGGFTVELWRAVAADMGLDYSLRVRPFHQLLQEFKDGKVDVMINLAISDERDQYAAYTVPHVTVHGAIFVRKNQSGISSEADLAGRPIIVMNADSGHEFALSKGWGKQLVLVENAAEGLKLLASGRHDAMLLGKLTGLLTLQTLGLDNIRALPASAGFSQKFAFATQHQRPELLAQLNEGLALSKTNGSYDALYAQWFGILQEHELGLHDVLIYIIPLLLLFLIWSGYWFYRRHVERALASAAVAASRDLLLTIIDTVPVRVFWKDRELRYVGCNSAFARDAGFQSPRDIVGKDDFQLAWATQAEAYRADDQAVMASGHAKLFFDEPQTTPDGQTKWLRTSKVPIMDRNQKVVGLLGIYEDFSERKRAEEKLRDSESLKNVILNSMDAEIAVLDHEGVIVAVNEPWRQFARENASPAGEPDASAQVGANYLAACDNATGFDAAQARLISASIRSVLGAQKAVYSLRYTCHSPEQKRWFRLKVLPLGRGAQLGVVITHTNVTEQVLAEQAQASALGHLQKIASRVPGLVYQYRLRADGSSCFPYASEAIREIYEVSPQDVLSDASCVLQKIHPEDLQAVLSSIQTSARELGPWRQDYRVRHNDGSIHWLFGNAVAERESDGATLWHGFITDITLQKRMEDKVRQLAFHDVLTHLPNRRLLLDRLTQAMSASKRNKRYLALMFLDLDNFKTLNDTQGHQVGDLLLLEVAARLSACVREMDTVARFGGDEFVVMLNELSFDRAPSVLQTRAIAEKIRLSLSQPYELTVSHNGTADTRLTHPCSASIGVAVFTGDDADEDTVLKWADLAMYQAKDAGKNQVQVYFSPVSRLR